MHKTFSVACARSFLLLILSLTCTTGFALETMTWVSGVGADTNSCAREAPCKTFGGALLNTMDQGEINAMDSGEFDVTNYNDPTTATPLLISKSVSIDGGSLNIATMGPLNSINLDAITIDAGSNAHVILRNLVLNGLSGSNRIGIRILSARSVRIENVKVNSYWQSCIEIQSSTPLNVELMNVDLTGCANGLDVSGSNVNVSMDESSLTNNGNGIRATGSGVVVKYSDLTQDNLIETSALSGAVIGTSWFAFGELFTINTAQIPTLSEWAMFCLVSLMGWGAFARLRRRLNNN